MRKYKISIIIPTFNAEKDLHRAIDSLLNQTIGFRNLEVIIVDDNSTDNTKQIIIDYSKEYENIKYIFLKENTGSAGKPRNIGIINSTSKYIMFLDNDDEYVAEACEIFYNAIENSNENMIICTKTNSLYTNKDIPPKITENPILKKINVMENPNILFSKTDYPGAMWNIIYKKDFILNNYITCLENLPEDVYFMHQCYYRNSNISFITNLKLYNHYFYRISGKSITVTSNPSYLNKLFIMYDKLQELSKRFDNSEIFFKKFSDMYFNDMAIKIIQCKTTKTEKINLLKKYYDESKGLDLKMNYEISLIFHNLLKNKMFKLCYVYCEIIANLMTIKSNIR